MTMHTEQHLTSPVARLIPLQPKGFTPDRPKRSDRLAISTTEGTHIVKCSEILYCQAESNYCTIFCTNGSSILVSKTLKAVCEALPLQGFLRTHQSFVVAREHITEVSQDKLILAHEVIVPVARSRRGDVSRSIAQFCIQL